MVVSKQSGGFEVAIAVKKKIGIAVLRNRIRRRVSAALLAIKPQIKKGAMVTIFPFKAAKNRLFRELRQDLASLFKEAGLL